MKKIINKLVILIVFSLLTIVSSAQTINNTLKGLRIGDQMPDYRFPRVINSVEKSIDLRELKGKYVILDIWSSGCPSCIEGFPHMQKIQDEFKDKVKIILVNNWEGDKVDLITKILDRVKKNYYATIKLPVALYDKGFMSIFPKIDIATYVIIDPAGKIVAITDPEQMTQEKLHDLLNSKENKMVVKDYQPLDENLPLITQNYTGRMEGILFTSSLTTGYVGSRSIDRIKTNPNGEVVGFIRANFPLRALYADAYPELFAGIEKVIDETKDSFFQYVKGDHPKLFTYDIFTLPGRFSLDQLLMFLRSDLEKAFDFKVTKETRSLPCLIIKSNANVKKSFSKYTEYSGNYDVGAAIKNQIPVYMHYADISAPYNYGIFFKDAVKVINETGLKSKIDLDFPAGFDFENKEKVLRFYHNRGLDFMVENRDVQCVVFSDKPKEETK